MQPGLDMLLSDVILNGDDFAFPRKEKGGGAKVGSLEGRGGGGGREEK